MARQSDGFWTAAVQARAGDTYLLRVDGKVIERPQHMIMRVAIGIHKHDIEHMPYLDGLGSRREAQ